MTPDQQLSANGVRGLLVAAGLLVVLILGLVVVPRALPRLGAWPHARTLAFAWAWLVLAWALNGASLFYAGRGSFPVSWSCYWLSAACRAALLVVVVWRVVAVSRQGAGDATTFRES